MMPVFAVLAYVQRNRFAHHLVAVIMLAWFVQLPLNRLVMDPGPGVDWLGRTLALLAAATIGSVLGYSAAASARNRDKAL